MLHHGANRTQARAPVGLVGQVVGKEEDHVIQPLLKVLHLRAEHLVVRPRPVQQGAKHASRVTGCPARDMPGRRAGGAIGGG